MSRVMIIGCGGVASVAIAKCCQNSDVFTEIMIASRTKSKCDAMKEKLQPTTKTVITTAQVDADNTEELIALINEYKPDAVLNVALPYQDLTIMDACLATGVDYIDTANYEAENTDDSRMEKNLRRAAARKRDLQHTLIIPGSGLTRKSLKMQVLQQSSEADLIQVLQVFIPHMH